MAGQPDSNASPSCSALVTVSEPYRSVASFIAALRNGDPRAMTAFYLMYAPLLRDQARRMMLPDEEGEDLVGTVIGDLLLHLGEADVPPHDLSRYVIGAFRNRARNWHRDGVRRRAREEGAYSPSYAGRQRVVAECHSEYGIRTAHGADTEGAPALSAAIARLATLSAQALSPDDATLMIGLSRFIPLRDLATQSGISYGAARVRVHRLRERFVKLARAHVAGLGDDERQELERFFRRAGIVLNAERHPGPPAPRVTPRPASGDDEETGT